MPSYDGLTTSVIGQCQEGFQGLLSASRSNSMDSSVPKEEGGKQRDQRYEWGFPPDVAELAPLPGFDPQEALLWDLSHSPNYLRMDIHLLGKPST